MRVAYADPPYIGQAQKHYGRSEVNHRHLIAFLETFDIWALSCSSTSLQQILSYCPNDVRISAWVKPFCAFHVGVNPAYAWEPIIWKSKRKRVRSQPTLRDWISCNITMKKGVHGAKPEDFCIWLFDLLNVQWDDTFYDLFPGSGAVTAALELWSPDAIR